MLSPGWSFKHVFHIPPKLYRNVFSDVSQQEYISTSHAVHKFDINSIFCFEEIHVERWLKWN